MRKLSRIGDPKIVEGIVRLPARLLGESGDGVVEITARVVIVVSAWEQAGSPQRWVSMGIDRMEAGTADRLCGVELFVPIEMFSDGAGLRRPDVPRAIFD